MISENLTAYFETAIKNNWDKLSLQDYDNGGLTFGELANQILCLHNLYREHGIVKGDKIVVIGKNSAYWGSVYLATVTYGAVIVPLLQDFTAKDIYKLVNHSDAQLMFASEYICEKLNFNEFENLRTVYYLDDFAVAYDYTADFIAYNKASNPVTPDKFKLDHVPNSELAAILYTSGTSGQPKGVMLNHNSLAANVRYARANMPLQSGDRIVSFLPLAHCYGAAFEFLFPFSKGCTIIFLGKLPSPQVILKAFGEIKPRLILSVPLVIEKVYKNKIKPTLDKPIIKFILKIPILKRLIYMKVLASLKVAFGGDFKEIVVGGAKMNREVETFLRAIGFNFSVGYGMTECGPLISYDGWKTTKIYSAGKLIDCMEIKIDSKEPGKVGEILLKGENVMLGYYKNQEETEKAFDKDGWLHTGDLGVIDEDNYLFIKGRSKSMILTGSGQNVYPEEVESKFNNFPLISEVVVIGRNNLITALIYPDKEKIKSLDLKPEQVEKVILNYQKRVNEELPTYMQVNKIVIREEEFEKTPKKNIKRYLYE
ncbi:MAG TPA: AMP-binding protein [Bacteroidales bacterium]|nr:AMP-binding protein [Bacteroidales bacterium]